MFCSFCSFAAFSARSFSSSACSFSFSFGSYFLFLLAVHLYGFVEHIEKHFQHIAVLLAVLDVVLY
jgi:hypothetical protein